MSDAPHAISERETQESLDQFVTAILERGKSLPPQCAENTKPHVAAQAMMMLAQGRPYRQIRAATGLGHETIRRLEWNHADTLEEKRKVFSVRFAMIAQEYTDLMFEKAEQLADDPEELKKIQPDKLALTVGIMSDQAAKLSGMATSELEHKRGMSIDDALMAIEEARVRAQNKIRERIIEAEIIDA